MADELLKQICVQLKSNLDIHKLIVFGSYLNGNVTDDSDIDLIVILNESGFSKNYEDKISKRSRITKLLTDIRKKIPLDVLVYTKDEWERLLLKNSSFVRRIKETGVAIN